MTAIETKIPGVMTIETDVFVVDHRGYFDEIYNKPKHESLGTKAVFVQDNMFFCTERNIACSLLTEPSICSGDKETVIDVAVDFRKVSFTRN